MKTYKELLNQVAQESNVLRQLTEEESLALKNALLCMYKDVKSLCDSHNLVLMLCGGSCLGAIRHQGFIPWDDDLDLMMSRSDYEVLISLLEAGSLGDDYEFTYPGGNQDAPSCFLKIFKKSTKCVEIGAQDSVYPKGIFLDIFILDGASSCSLKRKLTGITANSLRFISNNVSTAFSQVSDLEKAFYKTNNAAYFQFLCRRMIGRLLAVIPHKTWISWFDRLVANKKQSGLMCLPTGRMLYGGECFPSLVYFPPIHASFEGLDVLIPNGYDAYLKNLYHDYMKLPPVEKRERHFIVDFDLDTPNCNNK